MKNVVRARLDDRKTSVKLMTAFTIPGEGEEEDETGFTSTFNGVIYNDDQENDDTLTLRIRKGSVTGWTITVTIDGDEVEDGETFNITASGIAVIQIVLEKDDTAPIPGECCFTTLQMYSSSAQDLLTNSQDVFKIVGVLPVITFSDIELNMEQLIEDKIIFPDDADKLSADVIQSFIDTETKDILEFLLKRFNSITIPDYEYVREFIINRVKKDCYKRFVDYSISGGGEFTQNLTALKIEAEEIAKHIQADGDVDW